VLHSRRSFRRAPPATVVSASLTHDRYRDDDESTTTGVTLTTDVVTVLLDGALGAWLGTMAFFSFVGAPRAFAVFGDEAGAYVNDVFPRYYTLGVGMGTVALLAGLGLGVLGGFESAVLVVVASAVVAVALAAYSRWVLIPKMDAVGEDAFETYHRQSVLLNGAAMLAVAVALVASHLA
jgi:hypothetical protein